MSFIAKKKIIFITTGLNTGGAEHMLFKLLQHFDRQSFELFVISLRTLGDIGPCIKELGIPVFTVGMKPGLSAVIHLPLLIKLIRKIKPDIVQTWMHHADLLGGIAAKLAGCHCVVWGLRQSNLSAINSKLTSRMVLRVLALLSHMLPLEILSCSTRARTVHSAVGYPINKIHVIPNGFDLDRFRPNKEARKSVRKELQIADHIYLVGLMARFDPQKNHVGFINVAKLVNVDLPDVHFVMAGNQIDHKNLQLQILIRSKHLNDRIHLLGQRDDMPRLISALDVLVSTSSYGEAFPNVLGEAMACGVTCVVTDVGDSAEIVGETGRVVPAEDMHSLAKYIVDLLLLPLEKRTALGRQARERIAKNYEINHVVRLYESFYDGLINARSKKFKEINS